MKNLTPLILALIGLTACSQLVGGPVTAAKPAKGVWYYLPRAQFVTEQEVKEGKIETTVRLMRVPDRGYPYHVYLQQGLFSTDIFDLQLNDQGILSSVSGDATDKTIESVKAVASFAVGLVYPQAITGSIAQNPTQTLIADARENLFLVAYGNVSTPPTEPPCKQHLEALKADYNEMKLDSFASFLDSYVTTVNGAKEGLTKPQQTPSSPVEARAKAQTSLEQALACLTSIDSYEPIFQSKLKEKIDGEQWKNAHEVIRKKFMVEDKNAQLGAAVNSLAVALTDGYLNLEPKEATDELERLQKISSASELKGLLTLDSLNKIQKKVQAAASNCGGLVKKETEIAKLEAVVRLMEGDINCLLKAIEFRVAEIDKIQAALTDIGTIIEFLLEPSQGQENATRRATPPLTFGRLQPDESFTYETMLHRTMRARDRIKEFMWRRRAWVNQEKFYQERLAAVQEALGRIPEIKRLLEHRTVLLNFLKQPITAETSKARSSIQSELEKIETKLESTKSIRPVAIEPVGRTITPQVLWVTNTSDVPAQGEKGGRPGDVFVILRPIVREDMRQ